MDPDDMFLNQNLFKQLFNYNKKANLDIIELKLNLCLQCLTIFQDINEINNNDN